MFKRSQTERVLSFEHSTTTSSSPASHSLSGEVHLTPSSSFSSTPTKGSSEVELFAYVFPGGLLGRWIGRCLRLRVGRFQCTIDPHHAQKGGSPPPPPRTTDPPLSEEDDFSFSSSSSSSPRSAYEAPFLGVRVVEVEADSVVPEMEVFPPSPAWRRQFAQVEKQQQQKKEEERQRHHHPSSLDVYRSSSFFSSLRSSSSSSGDEPSLSPPFFLPRLPLTYSERNKVQKRLLSSSILHADRFPLIWYDVEEEDGKSLTGELYVKGVGQPVKCHKFYTPRTTMVHPTAVSPTTTTTTTTSSSSSPSSLPVEGSNVPAGNAKRRVSGVPPLHSPVGDGFLHIHCSIPDIEAYGISKPSLWMRLFTILSTVEVEAKIPLDGKLS